MVKLIYGPKGFGKTKIIIDEANKTAQEAKGQVVFITDKKMYSVSLNFDIRYLISEDYDIDSADSFRGFLCGLCAANFDNEYIFVDGISRITGEGLDKLENFFRSVDAIINKNGVKMIFTISSSFEDLPEYLKKYL